MEKKSRTRILNKKIGLFLLSQNVSLFGSSVVAFAIVWYITLETSSGLWLMLSTISSMLPQIVISLWSGVWADRYNRKALIMIADGFIAIATFGLAVAFYFGFKHLELLLAVSVVRSLGAGIQSPAVNAIFPQIVPQENLTKVQGLFQTVSSILMLIAPAVGGLVLEMMDISWAFMLDVITAALAIVIFNFIKVDKLEVKESKTSFFTDLKEGVKYTLEHPLLRGIIICYAFSFFLITPAAVLTPLLVQRSFGDEIWRLTANEIVWTVGSLIGGLYVSLHGNFKNKVRTVALCLVAFGITFGLLGVAPNFIIYLVIMGCAGFFMPILATTQTVFIQNITPVTMLGRVFSIIQIIAASAMPIAILFFGPLADVVSVGIILFISGILLALVGIIYHFSIKDKSNLVYENQKDV